jgi:DNA/RNA endonuclease G (NUC1)
MRFPQRRTLYLAVVCLIGFSFTTLPLVQSQVCSGCEVSNQTVTKSNQLLNLSDSEKADAESRHLLGGRPIPPASATNEHMLHQHEWITWYDDDLRVPVWVSYELTRADARASLERRDCFRRDPRLSDGVASFCADYEEPVFDRGHIFPSADASRGRFPMTNTFIFSNMAPQHDLFNRGIWARLEARVRAWAIVADGVYVVTGAVFDRNDDGQRDADADAELMFERVGVPSHFYKIVLHVRPSGFIDTISILLPHLDQGVGSTNTYLRNHITTIDEIEQLTGIDFFPELPDERETVVEAFRAPGLWNTQ